MTRAHRQPTLTTTLATTLTVTLTLSACIDAPRQPAAGDALAVLRLLRDTAKVATALDADATFWARDSAAPLTHDERAWLLPLFASFVDQDLALSSFADGFLQGSGKRAEEHALALRRAIGLTAYARQLQRRLDLLAKVGANEAITAALDEGSPDYGIAVGHLTRMAIETARPDAILRLDIAVDALRDAAGKLPAAGAAPADLNAAWNLLRKVQIAERKGKALPPDLAAKAAALDLDALAASVVKDALAVAQQARQAYHKVGGKLLHHVIGVMVGNEIAGVLDPIVKDIALWLGDTRLRSAERHLITEAQLDALLPTLEPGDIILERRNWYLSNLGLPGFWPHAALYVGSPTELEAWADDAGVRGVFPAGLTATIAKESPEAWAAYLEAHDDGPSRVIEAVSEGVVFASLHHSCLADHVAFLRPRRSRAERAYAIAESFRHWSKPYDFDFDFQTIQTLVCSELVYTAYDLPASVGARLQLDPLPDVMGRTTLPPNDIIARFDAEHGTAAQQLDFVAFLDGDEVAGLARVADLQALRASWQRPKWDLAQ